MRPTDSPISTCERAGPLAPHVSCARSMNLFSRAGQALVSGAIDFLAAFFSAPNRQEENPCTALIPAMAHFGSGASEAPLVIPDPDTSQRRVAPLQERPVPQRALASSASPVRRAVPRERPNSSSGVAIDA